MFYMCSIPSYAAFAKNATTDYIRTYGACIHACMNFIDMEKAFEIFRISFNSIYFLLSWVDFFSPPYTAYVYVICSR